MGGERAAAAPGGHVVKTLLLTATAMIAFAANSLLCRHALETGAADAASFTTLRLVSGAAALALLARGRALRPHGSWTAAVYLLAYALFFSLAYRRLTAGTGALLLFGAVQGTMIVLGIRAGERPPVRTWPGLLVALAGLLILTGPGLTQPDPAGAILMIAAGVAWGGYSLKGTGQRSPLESTAANFVRCVPMTIAVSVLALASGPPRVSAMGATLAIVSGAVTSGIGYAVWYAALPGLRASQAAVVQLTAPPLAALGGVVLLGEKATWRLLIAGVAILGGVALAVLTRRLGPGRGLAAAVSREGDEAV